MEIVHGADAQDTLVRERRADAVHERAARGTEVVGHGVARGDGARLAEGRQVVAAAQVLQVRVGDGEVGCERGRGESVAVGAVAGGGVDQARALDWLGGLGGGVGAEEMRWIWGVRRKGGGRKLAGRLSRVHGRADSGARLMTASCTAPQKHVAIASSSFDQLSSAQPARGM